MGKERILPDTLFAPVTAHLPDDTLGPESTIEFRIDTFTAVIDIQTLAALPAKARIVLLTDRECFAIRVILALHFFTSLRRQTAYPGDYPIRRKPP